MRWRRIAMMVGVVVGMTGCMEASYRMNEAIGINCRPAVVQRYGSCIGTARVLP